MDESVLEFDGMLLTVFNDPNAITVRHSRLDIGLGATVGVDANLSFV